VIRVAVLDRHPAVRHGVAAMLGGAPGFAFAGAVADRRDLDGLVYRTDPDIVIVDDLSARVQGRARVVLYAASVTPELLLAARVAGVAAVVDKADGDLLITLRRVHAGAAEVPPVDPVQHARLASRLDPRDRPIFAMRLAGTAPRDIASVAGLGVAALNARLAAIVRVLAPAATT
jgi:DNA-binding NarL/FixJ family response regulator